MSGVRARRQRADHEPAATPGSGAMFDRIAGRYDRLNRILSLGMDRRWRRRLCAALRPPGGPAPDRVLDVATGTADVALAIAASYEQARVFGLDPSAGMLELGREKILAARLCHRVHLVEGDAQCLSFADDSFAATSIAFGIRNVPDRRAALREMARVTRPGGRVVILELGRPRGLLLGPLARFHVRVVVPRLGAWLGGAAEYRYLERSIAAFPPSAAFAGIMAECGLEVLEVVPLTLAAANLYVARPRPG